MDCSSGVRAFQSPSVSFLPHYVWDGCYPARRRSQCARPAQQHERADAAQVYRSWTDASNYSRFARLMEYVNRAPDGRGWGPALTATIAFNDAALATGATLGLSWSRLLLVSRRASPADIDRAGAYCVRLDEQEDRRLYRRRRAWVWTAALTPEDQTNLRSHPRHLQTCSRKPPAEHDQRAP